MMSGQNMRNTIQQQQQQNQQMIYPSPYQMMPPPEPSYLTYPPPYHMPPTSHHHYAIPMVPAQTIFSGGYQMGPQMGPQMGQMGSMSQHHQPYYQQFAMNYAKMNPYSSCMTSSVPPPSLPSMTSFRDLAANSPIGGSVYSLGTRSEVADIPEEEEILNVAEDRRRRLEAAAAAQRRRTSRENAGMSKFIRLDSLQDANEQVQKKEHIVVRKRSSGGQKQIFPMFFGLDNGNGNEPSREDEPRSGRGSALDNLKARSIGLSLSKRLSMTSLTSLTSIDVMTPSNEVPPMINTDKTPASKLAADLMQMYSNNEDTDVIIRTQDGDLHAHKCILSATCAFFRQQLLKSKRVEMMGFSKNAVHFLLCFLYGGLTSIPDDVDAWEVIALATHLNHKDLADVVALHLKATRCHWFHRPCASCVASVFDCLPQLQSIRGLRPLYDEAMAWQAKHFARIWKGRVFIYLPEQWQKECYEAVIEQLNDETVIETMLGCERLQVALPRLKAESASQVLSLVDDILNVSMQYLTHSFHLVVTSKSFKQQGKGLALNLGLLEELLPALIHSLSADVAIKTYIGLNDLLEEIQDDYLQSQASPKKSIALSMQFEKWSTRFITLVKRLHEMVDKHLLHYAASVVNSDAWNLLDRATQARIQETGLFIEMRQAKAPPPRLSSHNRSYKRSASTGVRMGTSQYQQRAKSAERTFRPLSIIEQSPGINSSEDVSKSGSANDISKIADVPQKSLIPTSKTEASSKTSQAKLPVKKPVKDNLPPEKPKPSTSNVVTTQQKKPEIPRPVSKHEKPTAVSGNQEAKIEMTAPTTTPRVAKDKSPSSSSAKETTGIETPDKSLPKKVESPKLKERNTEMARKKSPVKKRVIESEDGRLERQTTHTIMAGPKSSGLPNPDAVKSAELPAAAKPKSVVKPMVQESASTVSSPPNFKPVVTKPSSLRQPTASANTSISRTPTPRQSAIPKATTQTTQRAPPTATSKLQSGVARPKEVAKSATPATSTSTSKTPQKTPIRGPKKDTNSIEK
ncbi:hypothetical protein WR25_22152 isoform B [Diploscapter pachys]|nr:hypothetical protein WR25_22152 isoform B [Diploscapter pachys]